MANETFFCTALLFTEVNPSYNSPFGISMIVLTTILLFVIICTMFIVIWNRENIIIKSAR